MKVGQGRQSWRLLLLGVALLGGCAASQQHVDKALLAERGGPGRNQGVAERYLIGCPDVVDVTVHGHPEWSGRQTVASDGRIAFGDLRLRIEGRTVTEAALHFADELELPPERVTVRVVEYRSQHVYLVGEVAGLKRAVAYQGPETVLDLLQRTGGITSGAAVGEIYVLRAQVAEGKPPEVYHVNLRAIVEHKDDHTNLRLQPFDRIFVGETRKSCLAKCVPPWLRPLFEKLCGMKR